MKVLQLKKGGRKMFDLWEWLLIDDYISEEEIDEEEIIEENTDKEKGFWNWLIDFLRG